MFAIAIFIELYAYTIFSVGIASLLTPIYIIFSSILIIGTGLWYFLTRVNSKELFTEVKSEIKILINNRQTVLLLLVIFFLTAINIVAALGPEFAFDALWYHLTLPKIYIEQGSIGYIPGGLFYYSTMPKIIDVLYIPPLMFGNEIFAKLIHNFFSLLTVLAIYIYTNRYTARKYALLAVIIFLSNLVVSWQSTTAYIDLGRTFFEFMALIGFINYQETKSKKWLFEGGLMLGAALTTKWVAFASIPIFITLFLLLKEPLTEKVKHLGVFISTALFVVLPFIILSYVWTSNPFYPLFSNYYQLPFSLILKNVVNIQNLWNNFLFASDPISPVYLITLPLIFFIWKKLTPVKKTFIIYSVLSLVFWLFTPGTGGTRFLMPYLPAFSVMSILVIEKIDSKSIKNVTIGIIIIVALITIAYRGTATSRNIPYLLNFQTKEAFLAENLNFSYGDFYDTDGFLKNNISPNDKVLIYGIHNLYYVDFPFIHESYVKKGDEFNYILTGTNTDVPQRFKNWDRIYFNPLTGVSLYTNNKIKWVY